MILVLKLNFYFCSLSLCALQVKTRAIQFFQDLCKQFLNSVELKSPTGSCTSESSLGVDICSTPDDSVGPSGQPHLCTDGSQTDSGYPSPEGLSYEYNPEKAFKMAASLDVKGKQDGAKKSPTSQRIKDAILGGRKTPTKQQQQPQQGKGKDSDQAGVMVLAKELEARTRLEEEDTHCANIIVAAHGAWIRELIRHFVYDLECNIPGGKHIANRMTYNTGMCKFEVDLSNLSNELRPHIRCMYMHKKEHLQEIQVHLRETPWGVLSVNVALRRKEQNSAPFKNGHKINAMVRDKNMEAVWVWKGKIQGKLYSPWSRV